MSKEARLAPLLAIGMLSMACGVWLGLVRLGWNLPLPWPDRLVAHGPLMVCGFLGTLIGLERAVAIGSRWAYAAPLATAAGALLIAFGPSRAAGPLLVTAGSVVVVAVFAVICRRQRSLFAFTMAFGGVAWAVGNAWWLAGAGIFRVVFWWIAFLVLTIAGERLELNRVLRPTRAVRLTFALATGLVLAGAGLTARWAQLGTRVLGAGLIALTWWLGRHDVARRTVRRHGLTRFMAACLLGGYAWLGLGGVLALLSDGATAGPRHDAMLHAIFLGFVMSMVFAHAPVIVPAVLGVPLEYRPAFYVHAAVLHASLILRVVGDLVESLGRWRVWGGLLNAAALLLFVVNTVWRLRASQPVPVSASGDGR